MTRVRDGDQDAAEMLITEFEPQIRRLVRFRLTDPQLRRTVDSADICQSVFTNFFIRISLGDFEFQEPRQLFGLLATMARNKLIQRYRKEACRRPQDGQLIFYGELAEELQATSMSPTPSQVVAAKELVEKLEGKLSPDEIRISELRRDGKSWGEISEMLGEGADALRKRLSRACDRVLKQFEY